MRISYWSSEVCSSDLVADAAVAAILEVLAVPLEALHQVAHGRGQVVGKPVVGLVFVVGPAVGRDRRLVADPERNGAALHAGALHALGAVLPVDVEVLGDRLEERRAGKVSVRTGRTGWSSGQ